MIFFLHGDDTYRSKEKLRTLKEAFLKNVDSSGTNFIVLDGDIVSASEIWGAMAAQSFLVKKRMVVVENIGAPKSDAVRNEVAAFLDRIPEDVVVVFWEGAHVKVDKRKKKDIFGLLLKEKFAQEFIPLKGVQLEKWATSYAKSVGAVLQPAAARELAVIVGGDLWRITREIEKLAMMAPSESFPSMAHNSQPAIITLQLIREHVEHAQAEDIFAFVDALGRGDQKTTTRELDALLGSGIDPQYIVIMIARQLRLLLMTIDCVQRGVPQTSIASEIGCHPFVVKKLVGQAHRQSVTQLKSLYPKLLELDRRLKSSRAPRGALLELFCLEVANK